MKRFIKKLLFGEGKAPRAVWYGPAAGVKLNIDPAAKAQRILGLDEREIAADFRRLAQGAKGFIDVGANDGYYCVLARHFNPTLATLGCEADAAYEAAARENFKLNFGEAPPPLQWEACFVGVGTTEKPLDQLAVGLPRPLFLKIDVDGAELAVLDSASRLLDEPGTTLIVETHSPELEKGCLERLAARGYRCRILNPAWWRALVPEHRPLPHNRWFVAERG